MSTDHVSPRVSSLLLTQLLEGIVHCTSHGVAHRDLKTDNLLLDESCHGHCPRLLIIDFGSCLADSRWGLKLPFITVETDRGGNVRLMAPEVTWMTVHSPLITWNHAWVQCVSCYFVSAALNWLFSASPSPLKRQYKATYQTIKQSCPSTDNNQCCYKNTSLTISLHFPVFVRRQKLRNTKRNSQGCCFAFERIYLNFPQECSSLF